VGFDVSDLGDSPVVPWRPDRARPQAQNLEAVLNVVQTTANRVADALREGDRTVLVLGGDCTVGIGTIAGVRATQDDIAVAYFDLHSDLNTPASARDGALDWMAIGHMLGIDGAEPTLVAATEKVPLLESGQIVLFAQSLSHATRFERGEIERLGLARIALEDVRGDPEASARQALEFLAARSDRYAHPPRRRCRRLHRRAPLGAPLTQHRREARRDAQRPEDPRFRARTRRDHAHRAQSPERRLRRRIAPAQRWCDPPPSRSPTPPTPSATWSMT
jgi:hypothetical protein